MKTKILLLTLLISLAVIPLHAQTYHQGDSTALRAIDASCDASNKLNWNTESDPGKWDGVTWDNSAPKRVTQLDVAGKTLSSAMNVSALTDLTVLSCYMNELTSLNVSGLTNLKSMECRVNKLTTLDLSSLTNLDTLYCPYNHLTSLNVSGLTNLKLLHCYSNQLTSLDVSGLTNLTDLECFSNHLINLNASSLNNLTTLDCEDNQLTSLNVSGLTSLQYLYCYFNQLTSLDASTLTNLQYLICLSNQLTSLNVSGLTNLVVLHCYSNQLTSLDVSSLSNLVYFSCDTNQLTSLDVSGLTKLTNLSCKENKLPFSSLATGLNVTTYTYSPQNAIFTPITLAGTIIIDYSAEALINGTVTSFTFYKNGSAAETNTTGRFTTVGAGTYHCEMTNAKFPGLTLTTATITITSDPATLSVLPSALNINAPANSTATLNVTSNTAWGASSSEGWLNVNPISGTLNKTITLTAEANPTTTPRTATVTVSTIGLTSQTVTVTQAGITPVLSVSTSTLNIGFAAGNDTWFDVTSNIDWNVTSSKSWLTVSPASGSNNGNIVLTAETNPADTSRTAIVTVSGTGVTSQTIVVSQAATPALTVSASTLDIKAAANSTVTFTITSNTTWNITSSQPWLTIGTPAGSNNGTITLTAASNPSTTTRMATITISGAGVTSQTITITQAVKGATAITEVTENDNNVYPNPVKDKLNISLSSEALPSTIGIYSMGGKALLLLKTNTSITEMNMENYQPGMYLIKIMTPTRIIEKKILKL